MKTTALIHPQNALPENEAPRAHIPCCDHYAGNEKLLKKSLELQAQLGPIFDITADNEDGAACGNEIKNLKDLLAVIVAAPEMHRIGVRIHPYSSPWWREEMDLVVASVGRRLSHLTIPKVDDAAQLREMLEELNSALRRHTIDRVIPVHVLIESIRAVRNVWEIAATPGLRGLDFGLMDYVSSFGGAIPAAAMRSPEQFTNAQVIRAKTEIVAAAIAHGLVPAHNVTPNFGDSGVTFADATRARHTYGFLRMWSVHPCQVPAIVAAFSPQADEIERAAAILIAAQAAQWGPIRYHAELHDRASYRILWSQLCTARAYGLKIPAAAEKFFSSESVS